MKSISPGAPPPSLDSLQSRPSDNLRATIHPAGFLSTALPGEEAGMELSQGKG